MKNKKIILAGLLLISMMGFSKTKTNVKTTKKKTSVKQVSNKKTLTNEEITERNKKIVLDFYNLAFGQGKFKEARDKYMGNTYIQHNPTVPDGPEAFVNAMSTFTQKFPELKGEVKRVIAEGDLVMLHVHTKTTSDARGRAVVDIFRVDENGKIVEHWDVGQDIPEKAANNNTMF